MISILHFFRSGIFRSLFTRTRIRPVLQPLEDRTVPTIITVANSNVMGAGSLRPAILAAYGSAGANMITFDPSDY
jgi:hypothetical protein